MGAVTARALLILAAGASRRMGQPKQLLTWAGATLLERAIYQAQATQLGPVVVVVGAFADRIAPLAEATGALVVRHANWEQGLGSSIGFGMHHLQQTMPNLDGVVVMLGDQPLVDAEHLCNLVAAAENHPERLVVSAYHNTFGVPAYFQTNTFGPLQALSGDTGAKSLIKQFFDQVWMIPCPAAAVDVDTPADWQNLHQPSNLAVMLRNIEALRVDYSGHPLDVNTVASNPIEQFAEWMEEAINARVPEPNAMTLATCRPDGRPAARIVLLKGFDARGFIFYTNYESRKGQELDQHPYAALVFNWLELQRQVRIEGAVVKIDPAESERYFRTRPKGSQIGAWVSPQSQVINDRQALEEQAQALERQYQDAEFLPRPAHWGGYQVIPELIEFWQGQSSRLHDRIQYRRQEERWVLERLAP